MIKILYGHYIVNVLMDNQVEICDCSQTSVCILLIGSVLYREVHTRLLPL